jgi:small subunit ribosomal protein S15
MNITTEEKKKLYKEYGGTETNTGSVEANIAILTHRIKHISEHLQGKGTSR